MKVYTLDQFIAKKLKNDEFKYHYDRELIINDIAKIVHELRIACNLTQAAFAKKVGTSQSSIARIETGVDSRMPSIDLLVRIVVAANAKLKITIEQDSSA